MIGTSYNASKIGTPQHGAHMHELKIYAPTYYGSLNEQAEAKGLQEFDQPHVPIVVRSADGLRIVLGSHDYFDGNAPDVQIERRPRGWALFLHPLGGSDPCGYVYFLDDGRSFLVPESDFGTTPPIAVRPSDAVATEIDNLDKSPAERKQDTRTQKICELCANKLETSGDNWDGLCPECADFVSTYLERKGLTDEERDRAIKFLKTDPT
jgi:hypothetical protein